MADLLKDRFEESPLFTYCAIDMFRPFIVNAKRNNTKRCEAMFICLASRAMQMKVTHSLETNSFIQALRSFIAR